MKLFVFVVSEAAAEVKGVCLLLFSFRMVLLSTGPAAVVVEAVVKSSCEARGAFLPTGRVLEVKQFWRLPPPLRALPAPMAPIRGMAEEGRLSDVGVVAELPKSLSIGVLLLVIVVGNLGLAGGVGVPSVTVLAVPRGLTLF